MLYEYQVPIFLLFLAAEMRFQPLFRAWFSEFGVL
jgi:hypothetical protein